MHQIADWVQQPRDCEDYLHGFWWKQSMQICKSTIDKYRLNKKVCPWFIAYSVWRKAFLFIFFHQRNPSCSSHEQLNMIQSDQVNQSSELLLAYIKFISCRQSTHHTIYFVVLLSAEIFQIKFQICFYSQQKVVLIQKILGSGSVENTWPQEGEKKTNTEKNKRITNFPVGVGPVAFVLLSIVVYLYVFKDVPPPRVRFSFFCKVGGQRSAGCLQCKVRLQLTEMLATAQITSPFSTGQ